MPPSLLWPERVSCLAVSDLAALTAAVAVADEERMLVEVRGESHGKVEVKVNVMPMRFLMVMVVMMVTVMVIFPFLLLLQI